MRLLTSEQASSGLSVKHAKRFSARVYNSRLSTRPETPPPFGHPVKMGHPYLENYHSEGNSNRERTNQDKQMDMEESAKSVLTLPSHQPLSLIFTHCLFPCSLAPFPKSPAALRCGLVFQSLNLTRDSDQPTADKRNSASHSTKTFVMPRHGSNNSQSIHSSENLHQNRHASQESVKPPLVWDWDIEHEDRKRERKADATLRGAAPFEVDRRALKDVVHEKMGLEVGRIKFLSAGMS